MTKVKFAVVFAVLVCVTGIFPKSAKAEFYFDADGQSSWRPTLTKPSSNPQRSLIDSLYSQAYAARRAKNYASALEIYNKIISLDSQEAQAYFVRGSIKKSQLNDKNGAVKDFEMAAKLFRQEGKNYLSRKAIGEIQSIQSSNNNNSTYRSNSSSSVETQQRQCVAKVKRSQGYSSNESIVEVSDVFKFVSAVQNECATLFLSK